MRYKVAVGLFKHVTELAHQVLEFVYGFKLLRLRDAVLTELRVATHTHSIWLVVLSNMRICEVLLACVVESG